MTVVDLSRAPVELRLRRPRPGPQAAAVGVALAMLPLLRPSGPGNTGLVDLGVGAAVVVVLAATQRTGELARLPYVLGWGLMMTAGAFASLLAGPDGSALAVGQDALVLVWCAAVANAGRTAAVLRAVLRTWCTSALVWAAVFVVSYLAGISALSGVSTRDGARGSLTFQDPNLAGNYFVTALFVVLACRFPRRRALRWPGTVLLLTAVVLTGSNGAALSLALGLTVSGVLGVRRRRGVVAGVLVGSLLGIVVVVGQPHVDVRALQVRAAASVPLLRDSVGRSGESKAERDKLFTEAEALYWTGDLAGIGPGRTERVLAERDAPYVKEAHDDYLATLLERGVLGALGLVALVATVAVRLARVVGGPLRADYAAVLPRPELLAGACAGMLLSGIFYEVLHFRHLWALFGVIAAVDLWGRRS